MCGPSEQPNHHTALNAHTKKSIASYEMTDLYAPQGIDLGGVAPPQEKQK